MNMPKVLTCMASECCYNVQNVCHALAISVGDAALPRCNSYCQGACKGGDSGAIAGVGGCRLAHCLHNRNLLCHAPAINLARSGKEITCQLFRLRRP